MTKLSFAMICGLLFLLQSSFLPFFSFGEAQPDLWLVAAVISVIVFDRKTALMFAVIGGALTDIGTGNFFGLHLFPYLVTTLATVSYVREKYHRRILVSLIFTAAASLLNMVAMWCVIWFSGTSVGVLEYGLHRAWQIIGLNVLAGIVMHHLLWSVKKEWVAKW